MTNLAAFLVAAVMLIPALIIAIPVHELGHAVAAYFLGDRSIRYFGYFDLSPSKARRFFDVWGVLAVFIALVGWGRRVPVQPNRINSTGQKILYELAGPAANLVAALAFGAVFRFLILNGNLPSVGSVMGVVAYAVWAIWFLNVSLFAFQLLPIPTLDGWAIIEALFRSRNPKFFFDVDSRRREVLIGVVAVIFVASFFHVPVLNIVMSPFYTPASLISAGQCIGYGVSGFNQLWPCLL